MDPRFVESNAKLYELIKSKKPFFIGRLSGCETVMTKQVITNKLNQATLYQLTNNAGILCKSHESLKKWANMYYESIKHSTSLGIWEKEGGMYTFMGSAQEFFIQAIKPASTYFAPCLDAFFFSGQAHTDARSPGWEEPLRGQRILIVSSFSDSIKSQITKNRLGKLFKTCPDWFSGCSFSFVSSPMTQAGNHKNIDWQENYKDLCNEIDNYDDKYDIALISCGGYGMLVSDYIFSKGKSSIYVGGCL
jgi:hypothetical protein